MNSEGVRPDDQASLVRPGKPDRFAFLEVRVVPSTFGKLGDWFSSQYSHVKQDLGITHKHDNNAAAGIQELWNNSAKLSKPTHTLTTAPSPRRSPR